MELVHQQWLVPIYLKKLGYHKKNITMVDRQGVIYRGRKKLNQWKSAHAIETKDRTLMMQLKMLMYF